MRLLRVATCNLNQWAMDFDTNLRNVKDSITRAKAAGAAIRVGPELELTGYGCEDHFLEQDTTAHAWECLTDILSGDYTDNILCSIGMPVIFNSVRYNCQVFCLNRKIIMIRPKMSLANDGNYREFRWFSAWTFKDEIVDFHLPIEVSEAISQEKVPFGYGYIQFLDVSMAAETCEELFTPNAPRIDLALNGVEVFMNASGSHHQLRKLNLRIDSIRNATRLCGGVYMYANHQGCDGGRLYYDGCCCIAVNGDVVAQGSQFSLKDVEVLDALVDLDAVSSYRASVSSFREQASHRTNVPFVKVPYKLCQSFRSGMVPTSPVEIMYHCPEEEIAFGPSCWLWDYLRRSQASGFLLPLSGGADSSSVAAIVGCMCQLVIKELLQCIINKAHDQGLLQMPLPSRDEAGFPVIQYADDTILIMKASQRDLWCLKGLLESFSLLTGLRVNYSKSCLIPLNMTQEKAANTAAVFGCSIGTMPFTYLGLPMGSTKPRVEHYGPIMNRTERKLTSISSMLTQAGKLQLVNAVLSSLPTFAMCTVQVPVTVLEYFDRARRHCMWRNSESNAKSKPLVAWKKCTRPKMKGGLGIINLRTQNMALQLKHLDKFFNQKDIPWVKLIWNTYYSNGQLPQTARAKGSFWWKDVLKLCDVFRGLAKCKVGNGKTVMFWSDIWNDSLLQHELSRLFSYAKKQKHISSPIPIGRRPPSTLSSASFTSGASGVHNSAGSNSTTASTRESE